MSWLIEIGLTAVAFWMIGFITGRMSQPSAAPTQAEIQRAVESTIRNMESGVQSDGFYMGPDGGYYYDDGRPYPDPETHAKGKAMTRRRDDSRPHTQPEGDWEEKA
jgi:hypothetical protein